MTASKRPRLRSEISRGHSLEDPNEGTSARTRPFSYDEVIHVRKAKKELTDSIKEAQEQEHSGRGESAPDLDHDGSGVNVAAGKHPINHAQEASSKEEKGYKVQESHSKSKNKGSHGLENRSKHKHEKDMKASTEGLRADRQDTKSQSKHKHEKDVKNIAEAADTNRRGNMHEKDVKNITEVADTSRRGNVHEKNGKNITEAADTNRRGNVHEKDVKNITEVADTNRRGQVRGKLDEKSHDFDSKSKLKHVKDAVNSTEASKFDGRRHASGKVGEVTHDMNARFKYRHEKDLKTSTSALTSDWQGHIRGKRAEQSYDVQSNSKHKHEKDVKRDAEKLKDDRRGHARSKQEERLKDPGNYDYERKHRRDSVIKRSEVIPEREKKRKVRSGDDEKIRLRDPVKEHDSGRKPDSVISEKNEKVELLKPYNNDSRPKRRRSRSEERAKDKGRRSRSVSLERLKNTLSHEHDRTQQPSTSQRDKSRHHSDFDRSKVSGNSSANHYRRSRSQERFKDKGRRSRSNSPERLKNTVSHEHDHGEPPSNSHKERSRHHSDVDRSKMSGNGSANHHRRHNGSSSGLGGYSPRKRKSEAAAKTPSPIHSPERKRVGWDRPSSEADIKLGSAAIPGSQIVSQTMPSNMVELVTGSSVTSNFGKPSSTIFLQGLPTFREAPADSVQLTQATRPMRRLYIDNIPASASEKDIMECFNTFLLSSGSNYIRGTRPCISCMINKDKGQALLEFLTPEDASSALSFDGKSLYGCALKIRRPKDYVDMASGSAERSKAGAGRTSVINNVADSQIVKDVAVSKVVKDSPNKIFIGGIADGVSYDMVMKIVSVFGPLKAFHFDINKDLNEPCAFLEYIDQSVTLKACAGLNGMQLGGRVLTVAQADPNTSSEENPETQPFYGIPEHVRPLLETPTQVLKLSNVLNQKVMESLSDTEVEEILEDVRLECSRFGAVVSINVVKHGNLSAAFTDPKEVVDDDQSNFMHGRERESHEHQLHSTLVEGAKDYDEADGGDAESLTAARDCDTNVSTEGEKQDLPRATANASVEVEAAETNTIEELIEDDKSVLHICEVDIGKDFQASAPSGVSAIENTADTNDSDVKPEETILESTVSSELELKENIVKLGDDETHHTDNLQQMDRGDDQLQEVTPVSNNCASEKPGSTKTDDFSIGDAFEVGCVLVEFRRAEASCMAAHCLHGRLFCDRSVSAEYVPLEAYRARFPK